MKGENLLQTKKKREKSEKENSFYYLLIVRSFRIEIELVGLTYLLIISNQYFCSRYLSVLNNI